MVFSFRGKGVFILIPFSKKNKNRILQPQFSAFFPLRGLQIAIRIAKSHLSVVYAKGGETKQTKKKPGTVSRANKCRLDPA